MSSRPTPAEAKNISEIFNGRLAFLCILTALVIAGVFVFVPPIPQDLAYHHYADERAWLGMPHAADVLSNLPFLAVGLWGLSLYAGAAGRTLALRTWSFPYGLFLGAVAAVAVGSAYYHWSPSNATLVWDRLPMSVAFMALFTALVADRIGEKQARWVLAPLIALGVASVFYWGITDDLRPYALVQFFPILLAIIICALYPPRNGLRRRHLAWLFVGYGAAKLLEAADVLVWNASGGLVSGHALKHLAAAAACGAIVAFIREHRPQT